MKTIDIKGKKYVMVHERIIHFRSDDAYKGWRMETYIPEKCLEKIDEYALFVTHIYDDLGQIRATGHAFERQDDGFINATSHVENAETSSWGRALANLGIGIEEGMASAEEVANAIKQQDEKPWMNQKQFWAMVDRLNKEPDLSKRAEEVEKAYKSFKVKKDYRKQFTELVESRDINI